jgi:hypothetical protein
MAASNFSTGFKAGARRTAWVAALAAGLLAGCGGGGDVATTPPLSCSVADQQTWLRGYMNDWYFWYATHPDPSPAAYGTVDDYFKALLNTGDATFPADRWSYVSTTESFNRFFGQGRTVGYGVMVAGLEVAGHPELPLYVRYVEPGSPAAAAGLVRGDQILSINGSSAASVISANDFSALSATAEGMSLNLRVRNAVGDRDLTLTSANYALVPVTNASVVTSPNGRKVGYLMVKDMISQAETPVDNAFASFIAGGVQDVVIDLRYNGGGLVSTGAQIASHPNNVVAGKVYASLLYNDRKAAGYNQQVRFSSLFANNTMALPRVYILTGQRTCSASEQLINGLRPFVNVVTIGDTTCGKPVGFLPQDDGCGNTFSVVNFESVNANTEGRYFDGFNATCAVADDTSVPLGSTAEPLLATALGHVDIGACPAGAAARMKPQAWRPATQRLHVAEPGDRGGMVVR